MVTTSKKIAMSDVGEDTDIGACEVLESHEVDFRHTFEECDDVDDVEEGEENVGLIEKKGRARGKRKRFRPRRRAAKEQGWTAAICGLLLFGLLILAVVVAMLFMLGNTSHSHTHSHSHSHSHTEAGSEPGQDMVVHDIRSPVDLKADISEVELQKEGEEKEAPQALFLETLRRRLTPRSWNVSAEPKQFMHMHHMKTGGTSVDQLIRCGLKRFKTVSTDLPYFRISECSGGVGRCEQALKKGKANECPVNSSSVMSYCAPLSAVQLFGWGASDKFTILRHPVDRIWSMYRFQLRSCYQCKELQDIFRDIEAGNSTLKKGTCSTQLQNHQTDNMLSLDMFVNQGEDRKINPALTEDQIIAMAIENMRQQFVLIGLTDQFNDTITMIQKVFPFLASNLTEASGGAVVTNVSCSIGHQNVGREPTCGTEELTDEIKEAILRSNQRDLAVYNAAVELFEQQKNILLAES